MICLLVKMFKQAEMILGSADKANLIMLAVIADSYHSAWVIVGSTTEQYALPFSDKFLVFNLPANCETCLFSVKLTYLKKKKKIGEFWGMSHEKVFSNIPVYLLCRS